MTREEWLEKAIEKFRGYFAECGYVVPDNIRVSCGWPSRAGLSAKKRRIGECWSEESSAGKVFEIFISPTLHEKRTVLSTLAHELVHATVGIAAGHKKPFIRCGKAIGLEGKATSMGGGEEFFHRILPLSMDLGNYPHAELTARTAPKTQSTRMIKCECSECGYTVRTTRKWLEDVGAPHCPDHGEMEVVS